MAMDAAKIKQIRSYLGLTQSQLAAKLDVYPSHVSKWERGENAISKKNEGKLWDLWNFWEQGDAPENHIVGIDPDGSSVTADEEAKRIDRMDDLSIRIDNLQSEKDQAHGEGKELSPDDALLLKELERDHLKATQRVYQIKKGESEIAVNTWANVQKGQKLKLAFKQDPWTLTEVAKSAEKDFTNWKDRLFKNLEDLTEKQMTMENLWSTYGLNPKTMTDEEKIQHFDKWMGEAIEKVNSVLTESFEGEEGQAFFKILKTKLNKKSLELQDQFKQAQQNVISKSSDREAELSQQIEQLKIQTRMLTENASVQAKLNEKMDYILEMNNQNLADIKAELAKSNQEKSLMQARFERLEAKLKETYEYIESSNEHEDAEFVRLREELQSIVDGTYGMDPRDQWK